MAKPKIVVSVEDVNGSLARFMREAPKEARKRLKVPVLLTAAKLEDRMEATAPKGPDAPHIANTVTFSVRGMTGQVGYLEQDFGGDPAGDNTDATIAEVALYNEYRPNRQPFMRPAAESEASEFAKRVTDALQSMERALSRRV